MKRQSWPFLKVNLDAVGIAHVDKLWHNFRATVKVDGTSHESIISAWQIITEFLLVNFTLILIAAS